ncbi:MAG: hypothetical protein KBT36_02750 [Kurthia sp.]|nr:hypothetical protein [Candidatus Kurthia equi]
MTKKSKDIVDQFLLEHLNVAPSLDQRFNGLNSDELHELAQHAIGLRIALRTSGKIQDDHRGALSNELQNLFQLNDIQIKEKIIFHSEKLKTEQ